MSELRWDEVSERVRAQLLEELRGHLHAERWELVEALQQQIFEWDERLAAFERLRSIRANNTNEQSHPGGFQHGKRG